MSADVLPAIAYGTLRAGCHNARLWDGLADHAAGWLHGFRLYKVAGAGFPIVQPSGDLDDRVRVDVLLWRSTEAAETGLERLDWLEGVPHLYRRERASVSLLGADYEVPGWVYLPNDGRLTRNAWSIKSGDWLDRGLETL